MEDDQEMDRGLLAQLYNCIYYDDMQTLRHLIDTGINIKDIQFTIRTDNLCMCAQSFETVSQNLQDTAEFTFGSGSNVSLEVMGTPVDLQSRDYSDTEIELLRRCSIGEAETESSEDPDDADDTEQQGVFLSESQHVGDDNHTELTATAEEDSVLQNSDKIPNLNSLGISNTGKNNDDAISSSQQESSPQEAVCSAKCIENTDYQSSKVHLTTASSGEILDAQIVTDALSVHKQIIAEKADVDDPELHQSIMVSTLDGPPVSEKLIESITNDNEYKFIKDTEDHNSDTGLVNGDKSTVLNTNDNRNCDNNGAIYFNVEPNDQRERLPNATVVPKEQTENPDCDDSIQCVETYLHWLETGECYHGELNLDQHFFIEGFMLPGEFASDTEPDSFDQIQKIAVTSKIGGLSPLHIAAARGHQTMTQFLLSYGCDINVATIETEDTPLHLASKHDKAEMMEMIMATGCDVYRANSNGDTAVHVAVDLDHEECVKVLTNNGVCMDIVNHITQQTPLMCAILHNNSSLMRHLLDAKDNVVDLDQEGPSGWTPLHQAASAGALQCVELLLASSADPNSTNEDGETPLHLAASNGFADCVRILLEAGAKCKPANSWIVGDNQTPLMLAAYHNYPDVVTLLLSHDDVNQVSEYGDTALHYATFRGCQEAVEGLLQSGADVNAKNHWGATPIWYAVSTAAIVRCLVEATASLNDISTGHDLDNIGTSVYEQEKSPIEVALKEGYFESAEVLLKAGCKVESHSWLLTGKVPRRFQGRNYNKMVESLKMLVSDKNPGTALKQLRRSRVRKQELQQINKDIEELSEQISKDNDTFIQGALALVLPPLVGKGKPK